MCCRDLRSLLPLLPGPFYSARRNLAQVHENTFSQELYRFSSSCLFIVMMGSVLHNLLHPNWKGPSCLYHRNRGPFSFPLPSPLPIPLRWKCFQQPLWYLFQFFWNLLVHVQNLGDFKIVFLLLTSSLIPPIVRDRFRTVSTLPSKLSLDWPCGPVLLNQETVYFAGVKCTVLYPSRGVCLLPLWEMC